MVATELTELVIKLIKSVYCSHLCSYFVNLGQMYINVPGPVSQIYH